MKMIEDAWTPIAIRERHLQYRGIFKYKKFCKNGNGHISTPRASQNVSIEGIDISRCDLAIFKHPDIKNGSRTPKMRGLDLVEISYI